MSFQLQPSTNPPTFGLSTELDIALYLENLITRQGCETEGQRDPWKQVRNYSSNGKIINMVYKTGDNRKLKCQRRLEEDWTSTPITFPLISPDDVSDEPLIIEAEVKGYLVRRVFVDQGAAVASPCLIVAIRKPKCQPSKPFSTTHTDWRDYPWTLMPWERFNNFVSRDWKRGP
ncbi:hypothetical protein Tco_0927413 [Tanacetum coccineum]